MTSMIMKMTPLMFAFALVLLTGCATGTALVTGEKRISVPFDHVKLYQTPPSGKYDVVGIVNGASGGHDQGSLDRATHAMKRKAASVGANGVIIQSAPGQSGGGGFFAGGFLSERTQISGQAIFVHPEK